MFENMEPIEVRMYLFFGFWIGLAIIVSIYGTIKKWSEETATKAVLPFLPIMGISGGLILFVPEGVSVWLILAIVIPFSILGTYSYLGYTKILFGMSRAVREAKEKRRLSRKPGESALDATTTSPERSEIEQEGDSDTADIVKTVFIILFSTIVIIVLTYLKATAQ